MCQVDLAYILFDKFEAAHSTMYPASNLNLFLSGSKRGPFAETSFHHHFRVSSGVVIDIKICIVMVELNMSKALGLPHLCLLGLAIMIGFIWISGYLL